MVDLNELPTILNSYSWGVSAEGNHLNKYLHTIWNVIDPAAKERLVCLAVLMPAPVHI
jgi:hypothetical protein